MLGSQPDPDTVLQQDVTTGAGTHLSAYPSSFALEDVAWRAQDSDCEVVEHLSGAPQPGASGLGCQGGGYPAFFIQDATEPTFGGIPRPGDTNGAPPAVSGLHAVAGVANAAELAWTPPADIPDFAGVELRYNLGTTAPANVTAGRDGGRLLSPSGTITGLPAGQQVVVSVFSRDWYGNVGPPMSILLTTPAYDNSALTARGTPFDFAYGTRSTVTGQLTDTLTGAGLAGATLTISRRVWQTTDAFTTIGAVTTAADGSYSFQQVPSTSYDYQVSYPGNPTHQAVVAAVRLRVFRALHVAANHPSAPAGSLVQLTATSNPPLVSGTAYLYLKDSLGTPRLIGPHRTDSAGRVTFVVHAPARGTTATYVIGLPATEHFINSATAVTVTGT